jgi:protein O-GlcNAc transferase
MLSEYGDIDIALDPFPFTGGLTSCEALWMGVPVITLPQSRAVSRQTFAFLNQIGMAELAAKNAEDYLRLATELACDASRLVHWRQTLRERMRKSTLMDVAGFSRDLEKTLLELYQNIESQVDFPRNCRQTQASN